MVEKIWIKVAPSTDPALVGKECVRAAWNKHLKITSKPIEVELTSDVHRAIGFGDIVRAEPPAKE